MSQARARVRRRVRRAQIVITAATVVLVLGVLVAMGLLVQARYRSDLIGRVDRDLNQSSAQIASLAAETTPLPTSSSTNIEADIQMIAPDGTVAFSGGQLRDQPPLWAPGDETGPHTVTAAVGEFRVVVFPFRGTSFLFAEPLGSVSESVATLREALLWAVLPTIVIVAAIVWFAVGRALRPVLVTSEREEQLVADLSHELRTPIAGIRVLLDNPSNDPAELEVDRQAILGQLRRLETLSSQVLTLAGANPAPTAARPVDLDEVVQREVTRLAPGGGCTIDTSLVRPGQVLGNEADLETMVANLLTNAIRHARTAVSVTLDELVGTVELSVQDDGDGVAPTDRESVFDRFTRCDDARADDTGGVGLGLAIVREIVAAHRGSVAVATSSMGGANFTVRFPSSSLASR